ncbi:hypothetical protein [Streptomyces sp. TRM49041]|uniref:hypothetical protein n=1 Tax=Streptomyces sp. TRM49041 TaxID=2603216 RepID=UPI0011EF305E|nr:hypothetical protein [Streptomyces sp. TRM49041]
MTSTADTTQHPDVSEISDLTEGVLPPSRTVDVRRHLDSCVLCADVRNSLEEIRGLLGTLPGPARMPVDVAERIDAALAAEALLNATTPDDTALVSRETVAAEPGRRPVRRKAAERPLAPPAGRPHGPTGPGRNPSRRRRHAVLGAVCGLAAVSLSVVLFQASRPTGDDPATAKADAAVSESHDARFSGTVLADRVRSLLVSPEGPGAKTPGLQREGGVDAQDVNPMRNLPGADMPLCVQRGLNRSEQPLASEPGEYAGRPAYLVLLPHPGADTQVDAYVLDATCATSKAATATADVLLKRSYARP